MSMRAFARTTSLNSLLRSMKPAIVSLQPLTRAMSSNHVNGNDEASLYLNTILDLVKKHKLVQGQVDRSEKVVEFVHPKELVSILDFPIEKDGASRDVLDKICELVIQYSVKTCHPYFYNQLYHGVDEYGVAGSWLTEALNTNNHTFEVAPAFIVVEKLFIEYCLKKFGYNQGDGIFCPGGSISNMYGMILARQRKMPDIKTKGMFGFSPLVAFTSDESHYSIAKGANWIGIGMENVVKVKSDSRGRMIPKELDKEIGKAKEAGKIPFFVNATSGTTVIGGYDDIESLARVTKKHDVWLHVDACWGGSVIMSKKLKHHLKGCEQSDSIAWNPHKMLCAPLQSSVFITRHNQALHEANSASARYLFQQDKFYDVSYDYGDKSIQCGRKVDAFKLWFMFKARGEDFLEKIVDNAFEQAEYLNQLIRSYPGFRPAFDTFDDLAGCTNVTFHYIPERLRNKVEDEQWWTEVAQAPPKIKERMIKKGSLMIGYQPLPHKGLKNFFRMVIPALPPPTKEDMDYVVQEIERCGKDL